MLPAERRRTIVDVVNEQGGSSVGELSERLDVSKATVRRDLRSLAEDGLVERTHGGALPVQTRAAEETYGQRGVQNLGAKRAIAERAVEEIQPRQAVFFDAGTTTMEVAKQATDGAFIAATNSPLLALELSDRGEVKLAGGTLREETQALVGPTGEAFLERTNFDLLFLGTNAVHPDAGLTTPNEDEARMKQLMVENADRVVLVADHTKFGLRSFVQFADLGAVDLLVTDEPVEGHHAEAIEAAGVDVADDLRE